MGTNDMRCADCQKVGTLFLWRGTVDILGVVVKTAGLRCRSCGETVFSEREVRRQERMVAAALVARGISAGNEFKLVRKAVGLRAHDVAEMFGVRPETVSRWERGTIAVPRTAAFALGELYQRPKVTRQKLAAFSR